MPVEALIDKPVVDEKPPPVVPVIVGVTGDAVVQNAVLPYEIVAAGCGVTV